MEQLLVDCCGGFSLNLNESANSRLTTFRGKFQEAEAINKNQRRYPFSVLDENVKKLKPIIEARGLIGELDHPTDSIIHFDKCSHLITKLWWEGKTLMGEGEILNTPYGKILKSLLSDGVRIGISSRGVGSGRTDENGILVIGESYKLITFDAVADPSTHNAFQERVKETYDPAIYQTPSQNFNQSKTISKQALVACFAGMIESQKRSMINKIN